MRSRPLVLAVVSALGAAVATPAPAQQAPGAMHVRIVSIVAAGGPRARDEAPKFTGLDPWARSELEKLPDARFDLWGSSYQRLTSGQRASFEQLPAGHAADVAWRPAAEGRFAVRVDITRPTTPPDPPGRQRVLGVDLDVADGAHCVVRCVQAVERAPAAKDLLLLLTASTRPLD